jgi:hypothetical protein
MRKLLQVTFLMPRILMWLPRFWNICGLLNKLIVTNLKNSNIPVNVESIIKLCCSRVIGLSCFPRPAFVQFYNKEKPTNLNYFLNVQRVILIIPFDGA